MNVSTSSKMRKDQVAASHYKTIAAALATTVPLVPNAISSIGSEAVLVRKLRQYLSLKRERRRRRSGRTRTGRSSGTTPSTHGNEDDERDGGNGDAERNVDSSSSYLRNLLGTLRRDGLVHASNKSLGVGVSRHISRSLLAQPDLVRGAEKVVSQAVDVVRDFIDGSFSLQTRFSETAIAIITVAIFRGRHPDVFALLETDHRIDAQDEIVRSLMFPFFEARRMGETRDGGTRPTLAAVAAAKSSRVVRVTPDTVNKTLFEMFVINMRHEPSTRVGLQYYQNLSQRLVRSWILNRLLIVLEPKEHRQQRFNRIEEPESAQLVIGGEQDISVPSEVADGQAQSVSKSPSEYEYDDGGTTTTAGEGGAGAAEAEAGTAAAGGKEGGGRKRGGSDGDDEDGREDSGFGTLSAPPPRKRRRTQQS